MYKIAILFLWLGVTFASSDIKVLSRHVTLTDSRDVLIYREFLQNGKIMFLGVDTASLKTFLLSEKDIKKKADNFAKTRLHEKLEKSPLKSANIKKGYFLTIDLCAKPKNPNKKFEKELFEFLVAIGEKNAKPVSVGIAISAKWIDEEKENFEYLIKLKKQNKLAIVWVNHSRDHDLNDGKFLTAANIDFTEEVLAVERALLLAGEVPSIFFRFPGLTYNDDLMTKLRGFSLIALDSNAWLNKGQKVKAGSIILIHGNGNEHDGIIKFFAEFRGRKTDFISLYLL